MGNTLYVELSEIAYPSLQPCGIQIGDVCLVLRVRSPMTKHHHLRATVLLAG